MTGILRCHPYVCIFRGFDLIMADLPKGFVVMIMSSPPNTIPVWNVHHSKDVETLFEFTNT